MIWYQTQINYNYEKTPAKILQFKINIVFQTRCLQDKRKVTALHIAAIKKGENEDIVKMLLDAKCDKNAQDHDGFTALHHAARYRILLNPYRAVCNYGDFTCFPRN